MRGAAHSGGKQKGLIMKLEELLKDSPDVLKAVTDAITKANEGQEDKLKHVRFADLSEGGYVSKDKYTSLETDLTGKNGELEKANALIAELKKGTGKDEKLQEKISNYETEISTLKQENATLKTENALKFALMGAGAMDVDYLLFKAKEHGAIELDESGKVKGESDLISALKTQHPAMFGGAGAQNQDRRVLENDLPSGRSDKTVSAEDFAKMGYASRLKLYNENPELYKALSNNQNT